MIILSCSVSLVMKETLKVPGIVMFRDVFAYSGWRKRGHVRVWCGGLATGAASTKAIKAKLSF